MVSNALGRVSLDVSSMFSNSTSAALQAQHAQRALTEWYVRVVWAFDTDNDWYITKDDFNYASDTPFKPLDEDADDVISRGVESNKKLFGFKSAYARTHTHS